MIFKLIALPIIGVILIAGVRRARRLDRSILARGIWLLVWGSAAVLILYPEITTRVASWVGIGRGSDLVFYIAIIVLTAVVLSLLVWVDNLDERISKLVGQHAIEEYERTSRDATRRGHHPDV
ncbi:DUF2304 domain-containing protein [Candidatus Uhrbacteria bacterium]|nr:DUF2304 domain-containing protein [Candidatus Uhrbacteria bacterium]